MSTLPTVLTGYGILYLCLSHFRLLSYFHLSSPLFASCFLPLYPLPFCICSCRNQFILTAFKRIVTHYMLPFTRTYYVC